MFNTKRTQAIFSLILAAGLWLLLIVLGSIFPSGSGMHRFFELLGGSGHGIIQALIYALFFFSMFELLEKRKFVRRQYSGFNLGLLPLQDQLVLSPEEVAQIKLNTIRLEQQGQSTLVGDFIKKACTQYRNDQSISETLQVFTAQVDNSKEQLEGDLEIVRYLLSSVVSLGFIGTLIGLSTSIGMAHLAKTAEGMPQITQSLYVAFDTTLVALLIGLILNFFYHRYLKEMDTFYSQSKAYVIDNLISRIYKGVG
jgi:biopolymer transport protein ExbB/TolQ